MSIPTERDWLNFITNSHYCQKIMEHRDSVFDSSGKDGFNSNLENYTTQIGLLIILLELTDRKAAGLILTTIVFRYVFEHGDMIQCGQFMDYADTFLELESEHGIKLKSMYEMYFSPFGA